MEENNIKNDDQNVEQIEVKKLDKRKEKSKINAEKARTVKLEKSKQQKELKQKYGDVLNETEKQESSDSEDEIIYVKPKDKNKKLAPMMNPFEEIERLKKEVEDMKKIALMAAEGKKIPRKKEIKKIIIEKEPEPKQEEIKKVNQMDELKKHYQRKIINF